MSKKIITMVFLLLPVVGNAQLIDPNTPRFEIKNPLFQEVKKLDSYFITIDRIHNSQLERLGVMDIDGSDYRFGDVIQKENRMRHEIELPKSDLWSVEYISQNMETFALRLNHPNTMMTIEQVLDYNSRIYQKNPGHPRNYSNIKIKKDESVILKSNNGPSYIITLRKVAQ